MANDTFDDYSVYVPYMSERPYCVDMVIEDIAPADILYIGVLVTLFIVSIIGNGSLIFLFLCVRSLRNVSNAFIINLAFGDLLYTSLFIPILIYSTLYHFRPLGEVFCKISILVNYASQDVSIFSMTALSVLRFRAVVFPLHPRPNRRTLYTVIGCAVIWLVSILLGYIPTDHCVITKSTSCATGEVLVQHYLDAYSDDFFKKWSVVQFVVLFLLPLLAISTMYGMMAYKLSCATLSTGRSSNADYVNNTRKRLATIVLLLVVTFTICWFPYHLYGLIVTNITDLDTAIMQKFETAKFLLTMLSSVINPLILYSLSAAFRKQLTNTFCSCCLACKAGRWRLIETNMTTLRNFGKSTTTQKRSTSSQPVTTSAT